MRKGVIIDINEVSKTAQEVILFLENGLGEEIKEVFVNINGSHLYSVASHGSVIVSRADRKISQEDIERAIQSAETLSLPSNKEIFKVFPKEFVVDGEKGIKEPEEMEGVKLEVEVIALCVFSPYLRNLTNTILKTEAQVGDIIPSPLAAAKAVLTPQQKELGVVLVDVGAGTTGLAVFREGDLIYMTIFPVGSDNITNDIAVGLQTDIEIAERIKKELGSCILKGSKKKERIEFSEEEAPLVFSQKTLTKIIESRVSEIFRHIEEELKKVGHNQLFPGGIVLTGGGAKLDGIEEIAKKETKLPVKIASHSKQKWQGVQDQIIFNTACGLILDGMETINDESEGIKIIGKDIISKLKKVFKHFIP